VFEFNRSDEGDGYASYMLSNSDGPQFEHEYRWMAWTYRAGRSDPKMAILALFVLEVFASIRTH
jgi:hypothetical protein